MIRGSRAVLLPPIPDIAHVDWIKALGVVVNSRLTVADHIDG